MYQTFLFTFADSRDEKKDKQQEDVAVYSEDVFAVADGVTLQFIDPYPTPSTSLIVAQQTVDAIMHTLSSDKSGVSSLYNAFEAANLAVTTIPNIKAHYAGTTVAYGFLHDSILYFAQLNDCGVMVFDKYGNREIDFILNQTEFINHLKQITEAQTLVPNTKEMHTYIREEIVNKKFDFSVLNGDASAKDFLHVGATDFKSGQLAFFYSDGFIPYVYDNAFVNLFSSQDVDKAVNDFVATKSAEAVNFKKERPWLVVKSLCYFFLRYALKENIIV